VEDDGVDAVDGEGNKSAQNDRTHDRQERNQGLPANFALRVSHRRLHG
jgi:hypothetical protein